jgi:hypothetical protein
MNYIKIAKWFYQQGRDDQVYDKSRTFEEALNHYIETQNAKEEFKRTYQKRTKKLGMFLCPYFDTFKTKEK